MVAHRIINNAYCKQILVYNQIRVTILQPLSMEPVNNEKHNQSPKGIMRLAVPLPCFFDVIKRQRLAGQRPQQGTKSCRMGRFSVCSYVRPFPPQASGIAGWASGLADWGSGLAGWASGWPIGGNRQTYIRTKERKISQFYRTLSPIGADALPP